MKGARVATSSWIWLLIHPDEYSEGRNNASSRVGARDPWFLEIVDTLSEGVKSRQEGDQNHAIGQGGLRINLRKDCWHPHSTHKGGGNALLFLAHLRRCNAVS